MGMLSKRVRETDRFDEWVRCRLIFFISFHFPSPFYRFASFVREAS
jgi:hypothetical protein